MVQEHEGARAEPASVQASDSEENKRASAQPANEQTKATDAHTVVQEQEGARAEPASNRPVTMKKTNGPVLRWPMMLRRPMNRPRLLMPMLGPRLEPGPGLG